MWCATVLLDANLILYIQIYFAFYFGITFSCLKVHGHDYCRWNWIFRFTKLGGGFCFYVVHEMGLKPCRNMGKVRVHVPSIGTA